MAVRILRCALLLFLFLSPTLAEQARKAVGFIVVSGKVAIIERSGRNTTEPALPGSMLFDGDEVRSGPDRVEVAYCTASGRTLVDMTPMAKVRFGHDGLESEGATSLKRLDACMLPDLSSSYQARDTENSFPIPQSDLSLNTDFDEFKGSLSDRAASIWKGAKERLAHDPNDLIGQVSRTAVLETLGLTDRALALYRLIKDRWPGAVWTQEPIARLSVAIALRPALRSSHTAAPIAERKTYGLLIGISKYKRSDWVPDLAYADQDAELFEDFLKSKLGGKLVPDKSVHKLINEQATRQKITDELSHFVRGKATGDSMLILFIAAHGRYVCIDKGTSKVVGKDQCADETAKVPYILTWDSSPEDPKTVGLSMKDFRDMVVENAGEFGQVLLIVDICHAGNIGNLERLPSSAVSKVLLGKGAGVLLATRSNEFAFESPTLGHGVFTYYVVKALNGDEQEIQPREDHFIHYQELALRVASRVEAITNHKQVPVNPSELPEFPIIDTRNKPGIVPWIGPYEEKTRSPADIVLSRRGSKPKFAVSPRSIPSLSTVSSLEIAQQTIVSYVQGEQIPQEAQDFERAAILFGREWQRAPDRAFTESRMLFCEARALLFRRSGEDRVPPDRLEQAREKLLRSIQIDPNRAYSYNALGLAYLEWGQYDASRYLEAVEAFMDAIRFAPYWAYPLHNLALTYEQLGRYEEAIRLYREAMRVAPWASYPAYNLALLLQRLNRVDDAKQEFLRAIAIGKEPLNKDPAAPYRWPRLADAYNALATLEVNRERWHQAERYLNTALRIDPTNLLVRHNLALIDVRRYHRPERAIQTWRELLTFEPESYTFRWNLAKALEGGGKTDEATKEYEQIVSQSSEQIGAWRALALIDIRSGRFGDAKFLIQRALKASIRNTELQQDLVEVDEIIAGQRPSMREYRDAVKHATKRAGLHP